jgi:hypothetical protein
MSARKYLVISAVVAIAGATGCDVTGPFRVIDDPRPILSVRIAPDSLSGNRGDTVRFTAQALGRGDRVAAEATVTWAVGDPSVARSLGDGGVLCVEPGISEVVASAGGRRALAFVRCRGTIAIVSPPE